MPFRNPSPPLTNFNFSDDEKQFLEQIWPWEQEHWNSSFGTPDEHNKRNQVKKTIRDSLWKIQNGYCAFCGLNLNLAFEIHREHIAPQYKHKHYIFEPENLVLACNYCNKKKGKKLTVINDTKVYSTTTFKILHPHRDDFSAFLECDYKKCELVFKIVGPEKEKTMNTIECVGLLDTHLMTQRGAVILKYHLRFEPELEESLSLIISSTRKKSF